MPSVDEINGANHRKIIDTLARSWRGVEQVEKEIYEHVAKIEGLEAERQALLRQLPDVSSCQLCGMRGQRGEVFDAETQMNIRCPRCWGRTSIEWFLEVQKQFAPQVYKSAEVQYSFNQKTPARMVTITINPR